MYAIKLEEVKANKKLEKQDNNCNKGYNNTKYKGNAQNWL